MLIALGWFIVDRINKAPMALAFFGAYFYLFMVASVAGDPSRAAEIFRAPDVHMALFFGMLMLTDPPTSPVRYGHQIAYGILVAVASFLLFEFFGWVYFLPAGLLLGNAIEGVCRWLVAARRGSLTGKSLDGEIPGRGNPWRDRRKRSRRGRRRSPATACG